MATLSPSLGAFQLKQTFPALASLPFLAPVGEVSLQDAFDWLKSHPTAVLSTAGSAAYYIWRAYQKRISAGTVLELDLEGQMIQEATSPLNEIIGLDKKMTLFGIIDALEHAANDNRIAGLLVRLGNVRLGFAQAQELHAAILRFRQRSGKKAIAYAEVFGEGRPSVVNFYVASAFDLIYMMPVGDVTLTGIWLNSPFFKNTLDKMGLAADVERRREHKSALNAILYDKFTPEHRAQIEHLVGGLLAQLCQGIADGRRIPAASMETLMAEGPYSAQEALDKKLVDGLAYRDQLYDEVLPQVFGKKPPLLFFSSYVSRVKSSWSRGPVVALITAHGMITRGKSSVMDEDGIKSDTMAAAIRSAANDKNVKAILIRVDSGGGSYYASDVIAREVINAKRKGKKVVVSMGNVAASGGYYISQNADAILVSPGTITGSIGVIYGKFIASGLAEKLGITFDQYDWHGKKARAFSSVHHWNEDERREVARFIDRMYADFKAKVAEGRRIPVEAVEELAQGKVWLGAAAVTSRLADRTGGLYDAIGVAKELLGAASVTVKRWPGKGKVVKAVLDPPKNSEELSYASPFGAAINVFRLLSFVGTVVPRRLIAAVLHSTEGAALSADATLITAADDQQ